MGSRATSIRFWWNSSLKYLFCPSHRSSFSTGSATEGVMACPSALQQQLNSTPHSAPTAPWVCRCRCRRIPRVAAVLLQLPFHGAAARSVPPHRRPRTPPEPGPLRCPWWRRRLLRLSARHPARRGWRTCGEAPPMPRQGTAGRAAAPAGEARVGVLRLRLARRAEASCSSDRRR